MRWHNKNPSKLDWADMWCSQCRSQDVPAG